MSHDLTKQIAQLIESQFPAIYREEGEALVAFVKAYYEFLESSPLYSYKLGRQIFDIADVDNSLEEFLKYFKETYLADLPFVFASDKRFVIKHITDYYRTKGSKQSLELLMRMLYNEKIDVYYPGEDVLRASDSTWYKPSYIEVTRGPRNASLLNKEITGVKSGAKGFVESIVEKRVQGKVFDVLYLSSIRGQFMTGERVTDNGNIDGAPRIKGSLTRLTVELGGRNNKIGDVFNVVTDQGLQGKVKVSAIRNATGRVNFNLIDGGWGFTADNRTDVYTSEAVLFVNNAIEYFLDETVCQKLEKITLISATGVLSANGLIGKTITSDLGGASGVVVASANTDANGAVTSAATANGVITVQMDAGTFTGQRNITFTAAPGYQVGEIISEQSEISITVNNTVGTFQIGERVTQSIREPVANTIVSQAFGTVLSANTTNVTVRPAWGTFNQSAPTALLTGNTSGATAVITGVVVTNPGARARVSAIAGNTATVNVIFGSFDVGNQVRGDNTLLIRTISSITNTGATTVYLQGNTSTNGVITQANSAAVEGIVIGSNNIALGIWGNTAPFYVNTEAYTSKIVTKRSTLISPPRYANGVIIEANSTIERIPGGRNANFTVGAIENVENNIAVYTDIIGGNNVIGIPYTQMSITGQGSGFGFVQNFTVNTGGTGYANNGVVAFSGGGYAGGNPIVSANATITTNGSGAITVITVTAPGAGYFTAPTFTLPATSGTQANVTINMNYGYGFPKNPNADNLNLIGDALTTESMDIGTIAVLANINPGAEYTADPFIRVRNKFIASYLRRDLVLNVANTAGTFAPGESVVQIVGGNTNFKGRVKSATIIGDAGFLFLERNTFAVDFTPGVPITGVSTGATANVTGVAQDEQSRFIGDNANITGEAISAEGVATAVEVLDSGFGYIDNGSVQLSRDDNPFIITATTFTGKQGVSEGYWKSTVSHLNSEKKLHDNKYYQEYSYDIQSGLSLNRYESILKKILHVSGTEMFGSVVKASKIDTPIAATQSVYVVNANLLTANTWNDSGVWNDDAPLS